MHYYYYFLGGLMVHDTNYGHVDSVYPIKFLCFEPPGHPNIGAKGGNILAILGHKMAILHSQPSQEKNSAGVKIPNLYLTCLRSWPGHPV